MKEVDILSKKGVDFINAIVVYCEDHNIELELIADVIKKTPEYKSKITSEANKKHLLVK